MTKGIVVALLAVQVSVAFVFAAALAVPFGMGEPGQPRGFGPAALLWGVGEMAWTVWTFSRRRHDGATDRTRWLAFAAVSTGLVGGAVAGLKLSDNYEYNAATWAMALLVTSGCRVGRFYLRRGPRRPRIGRYDVRPARGAEESK